MGSWTALELHERRRGTTRARRLPFREGAPNRSLRGANAHRIRESRQLATETHAGRQPGATAIGAIHRSAAAVCHACVPGRCPGARSKPSGSPSPGSEASPRYPAESKAVRLSLAIVVQVSNRLSTRPPIQGSRGAHKSESR
jgi:hypothetical protein